MLTQNNMIQIDWPAPNSTIYFRGNPITQATNYKYYRGNPIAQATDYKYYRGNPIAQATDYKERMKRYIPHLKKLDPVPRKFRYVHGS